MKSLSSRGAHSFGQEDFSTERSDLEYVVKEGPNKGVTDDSDTGNAIPPFATNEDPQGHEVTLHPQNTTSALMNGSGADRTPPANTDAGVTDTMDGILRVPEAKNIKDEVLATDFQVLPECAPLDFRRAVVKETGADYEEAAKSAVAAKRAVAERRSPVVWATRHGKRYHYRPNCGTSTPANVGRRFTA